LIQEIADAMQTNYDRPRIVGVVVQAADDLSKQGVVEEDDGSSNPYKVRWEDDGTLSEWLYPRDIVVPGQKQPQSKQGKAADIIWKYMSMPSPSFNARCSLRTLDPSQCPTSHGLSTCAGTDSEGTGINMTAFTQFVHFMAMRVASKAHKMGLLANEQMVCVHLYTYICVNMHAYMHTCMHACMHTYIHTYMHTYICVVVRYIHLYAHSSTLSHTLSLTHTHNHTHTTQAYSLPHEFREAFR